MGFGLGINASASTAKHRPQIALLPISTSAYDPLFRPAVVSCAPAYTTSDPSGCKISKTSSSRVRCCHRRTRTCHRGPSPVEQAFLPSHICVRRTLTLSSADCFRHLAPLKRTRYCHTYSIDCPGQGIAHRKSRTRRLPFVLLRPTLASYCCLGRSFLQSYRVLEDPLECCPHV